MVACPKFTINDNTVKISCLLMSTITDLLTFTIYFDLKIFDKGAPFYGNKINRHNIGLRSTLFHMLLPILFPIVHSMLLPILLPMLRPTLLPMLLPI